MARKNRAGQQNKQGPQKTTNAKPKLEATVQGPTYGPLDLDRFAPEMPMAMVLYASSCDGDRITYIARGQDRMVLAHGTMQQIISYSLGNPVQLKDQTYTRQVPAKQDGCKRRVLTEMDGNSTITLGGKRIELTTIIGNQFSVQKPIREGTPEFLGGVEVVVSRTIVPGYDLNQESGLYVPTPTYR